MTIRVKVSIAEFERLLDFQNLKVVVDPNGIGNKLKFINPPDFIELEAELLPDTRECCEFSIVKCSRMRATGLPCEKSHKPEHKCPTCEQVYPSHEALIVHQLEHVSKPEPTVAKTEMKCCGGLGPFGKCGRGTKKGCTGAHCRCMEQSCPNMHYIDCFEHYIHWEHPEPKPPKQSIEPQYTSAVVRPVQEEGSDWRERFRAKFLITPGIIDTDINLVEAFIETELTAQRKAVEEEVYGKARQQGLDAGITAGLKAAREELLKKLPEVYDFTTGVGTFQLNLRERVASFLS